MPRFLLCLLVLMSVVPARGDSASPDDREAVFERKIRPVLAGTCFRCHGGERTGGTLRVDSRGALLKGGDSGPAIVPGNPDESLLVRALRSEDDAPHMPPGKPLAPEAIREVEAWIRDGAHWPSGRSEAFSHRKHWAFEPLRQAHPNGTSDNPVDRFIGAALEAHHLRPSAPADKRTLLRRATFDLTGLPPTPDEVAAFLADDRPDALARVVDRLLASPQYGERWGRHWLDLVRYADTAGETADYPVPQAWRYRDYVIDAFNRDTPYDRFLREQIAGDLLAAKLPPSAGPDRYTECVIATGYLAVARRFGFDIAKDQYLTIEDTIDVLGKSVLGLTIACARCHDHKYDPITQTDYYALYGIFDSTRYPFPGCEKDKAPRDLVSLVTPAERARRVAALDRERAQAEGLKSAADRALTAAVRPPHETIAGDIPNGGEQTFDKAAGAERLANVAVHCGDMLSLAILPRNGHGADSTRIELEIREEGGSGRVWNVRQDLLAAAGRMSPETGLAPAGPWFVYDSATAPAAFTELVRDAFNIRGLLVWRGKDDTPTLCVNTGDREAVYFTVHHPPRTVSLHPGPNGGVTLAWVSPFDGRVSVSGRVADIDPSGGDGIAWTLTRTTGFGAELERARQALLAYNRAAKLRSEAQTSAEMAYAVAEGAPHDAPIHKRGNPDERGPEVARRFLQVLGGQTVPSGGGSGREALAGWLTDPRNPLPARVMVNRIWQHHFGAGLVKTANDFGTRGTPPSHPELLDELAARFVAGGWSIKAMHRLIMLSRAYQRSSFADPDVLTADPDNTWLARFTRRRLSAEEIRDAILVCSGDLDPSPAGAPPFPEPKTWGFTQHAPFTAEYDHDHRSVYLMTQRIKRHPFLALFDGADTNSSTEARQTSTVPTQALFFLNDPFVHAKAAHMAARLAASRDDRARVDHAFRLLFARAATDAEQQCAARFVSGYEPEIPAGDRRSAAWAAWLRVLFASNEFLYVD